MDPEGPTGVVHSLIPYESHQSADDVCLASRGFAPRCKAGCQDTVAARRGERSPPGGVRGLARGWGGVGWEACWPARCRNYIDIYNIYTSGLQEEESSVTTSLENVIDITSLSQWNSGGLVPTSN